MSAENFNTLYEPEVDIFHDVSDFAPGVIINIGTVDILGSILECICSDVVPALRTSSTLPPTLTLARG